MARAASDLDLRSVAILICTLNRPQAFKTFVQGVGKLELPEGCELTLCISDNNPASQEHGYIKSALEGFKHQVRYGYQSERGYANARNESLALGLATDAQIFFITDDDVIPDPSWIMEHLKAFDDSQAQIVCGAKASHKRDAQENLAVVDNVKRGVGTFNLAFRRDVVSTAGLGLEFDKAFNSTGGEDTDFLLRAKQNGAKIVWSCKALVLPQTADWQTNPKEAYQEQINLMLLRRSKARNDAAKSLAEGKLIKLVGQLIGGSLSALVFCMFSLLILPITALVSSKAHFKQKARLIKNWGKFIGPWQGVFLGPVARQDVRRNF